LPPGYVKTIEEEIFYEYAKLISRTVFNGKINYRFVSDRFKALRSEEISMSGTIREWQREQELPKKCVFCGAEDNLQCDHLIPRNRSGTDATDNIVLACGTCNASRGDKGIFQWLGLKQKDKLHRLVAGKYLKQLYELHVARGTLKIPKDAMSQLCPECKNSSACKKWGKAEELTCLCLESVF